MGKVKEPKVSEGWGSGYDSFRFHYFVDGLSLCGNYFKRKFASDSFRYEEKVHNMDCADCWKARNGGREWNG